MQHIPGLPGQPYNGIPVIGHPQIPIKHQMVHHLAQLICGHLCQFCVIGILIHPVIAYLSRVGPMDRINDHIGPIPLPAALHAPKQRPCNIRHVHLLKLAQAVGAVPAVIAAVFPKVAQYVIPQALIGKAVKCHLAQPFPVPLHDNLTGHCIQCLVILVMVNKKLVGHHILTPVQKDTLRRFTVTAGPSCFLIIGFHILRHIIMHHNPDIGLVDSHAESIGCHHDLGPVIDKVFLVLLTLPIA